MLNFILGFLLGGWVSLIIYACIAAGWDHNDGERNASA